MTNDDILKKCDHIIEQPLLTEEGFLNGACLNELHSAIKNIPPTYIRLQDNPEWTVKRITNYKEITGYCANWAIRQGYKEPHMAHPPNLEKVVSYLQACIRKEFDNDGWANLSLCDISKMLHGVLYEQSISVFDDWNKEEVMGHNWLDLDALLHNVCLSIRDERRANDRFDKKFEEEHGKLEENEI
jgi:hypothetical protein